MDNINDCNLNKILKGFNTVRLSQLLIDTVIEKMPMKDERFARNVKYTINDYVFCIIDVLKNRTSWNAYNWKIPGDTLRKKHKEWTIHNVYKALYIKLINIALTTNKAEKLKYLSMDSSIICDKNGNKDAQYSSQCRNQKGKTAKCIKINQIVTENGFTIGIDASPGNKHDTQLYEHTMNNMLIEDDAGKYANCNRYRRYLLADKGYDSKKIINDASERGYVPIIPQNRRNIQNPKKIRRLSRKHKKILKKRHIVENSFSWIKKFTKIRHLYEKNTETYMGLVYLALIIIVARRVF